MAGKDQYDKNLFHLLADERFQNWVKQGNDDDEWQAWLKDNPARISIVNEARKILNGLTPVAATNSKTIENNWGSLAKNLTVRSRWTSPKKHLVRYAAIISLIITSVWAIAYTVIHDSGTVLLTDFNQKRSFDISEDIHVALNAHSVLEAWEPSFTRPYHQVDLTYGEVFFDVTKTSGGKHPKLIVASRDLSIEVIGTKFNVKSRRGKTKVSLLRGSIRITYDGGQTFKMNPGDEIIYTHDRHELIQRTSSNEKAIPWLSDRLILNNNSLRTVAEIIEDHFGLEVFVAPTLEHRKLSGEMVDNDLDVLIKAIASSLDVEVRQHQHQLFITEKNKP